MNEPNRTIYIQSGVIPYIFKNGRLKILLITSMVKKNWIIPKGIVENDMDPRESAMKEAFEEAGISGDIENEIVGEYEYEKWGGLCQVTIYPCLVNRVYDDWPEKNVRQRKWCIEDEAVQNIQNRELKRIVKKFVTAKNVTGDIES
jgi:8-oxo-dGTP pyrophosphatase MutT (NUDIX family)